MSAVIKNSTRSNLTMLIHTEQMQLVEVTTNTNVGGGGSINAGPSSVSGGVSLQASHNNSSRYAATKLCTVIALSPGKSHRVEQGTELKQYYVTVFIGGTLRMQNVCWVTNQGREFKSDGSIWVSTVSKELKYNPKPRKPKNLFLTLIPLAAITMQVYDDFDLEEVVSVEESGCWDVTITVPQVSQIPAGYNAF